MNLNDTKTGAVTTDTENKNLLTMKKTIPPISNEMIAHENTRVSYKFSYFETFFKHYIKFSGRTSRKEFWLFVLYQNGIFFSTGIFWIVFRESLSMSFLPTLLGIFFWISLLPSCALVVRRFHDADRSGWIFLPFVISLVIKLSVSCLALSPSNLDGFLFSFMPSIVLIAYLIFILGQACRAGTDGDNKYGPNPRFRQILTNKTK
jgi:uncharacterized membrane protein YhaH (DUF805 family)